MLIDFHAHILPKADHGSDSLACSYIQLEKAMAASVDTIVATPHFYMEHDSVEHFLARRESAYQSLCAAGECRPRIMRAAEVAIWVGMEELPGLAELCLEGTNYILLEMPHGVWGEWVFQTIYEIQVQRNLRPIIVHVDRYDRNQIQRLLEMNVLAQVNAESLASRLSRKYFLRMFAEGTAHLLGSDAHGDAEEYRAFSRAAKLLGGLLEPIMDNAQRIIRNERII